MTLSNQHECAESSTGRSEAGQHLHHVDEGERLQSTQERNSQESRVRYPPEDGSQLAFALLLQLYFKANALLICM